MSEYVITLLAAAAVTYILTPAVRRFAIAVGAMHAARERDVHELPTPLLGGFAIYGGLVAALLLASRLSGLNSVFTSSNMAKGLLLAGGLVVIMGFVDDRWGMGALSKLAGQVAAGVILVWSGAAIPWLPAPGGVTLALTGDQQIAVTILVVVVTMNAVNFIDGLDGLAAGIVGIGAVAFFAYYFTLTHRLGLVDQAGPALVAVMLVGVCIGFLPHNFYPARIFMGDTGSMLIGLMLAYAPISSLALTAPSSFTDYAAGAVNRYGAFIPLLVPGAILLIPYADLLMAVVRRTRAGKSVFAPDKKHLQHRLLAIGHSHRTSVLIMYLWAALFSGTVILLSIVRTPLFVLAIVTVVAVLVLLLVTMPRLRPWSRATAGNGAAGRRSPRPASPAPEDVAPAAPAGTAPAGTVPARTAPASPAPASARAGAASAVPASAVPAGAAAAGQRQATAGQAQGRQAGAGAVQVPETTRGNAARAAIRARLAESLGGNGAAGNGGAPGRDRAGNGARGNVAAPPEGRGRQDDTAGPDAPATTPEDETGLPVTRAAGPGERPWDSDDDTLPPRSAGQAVPPWEADDARPSPKPARSARGQGADHKTAPPDDVRAMRPPWVTDGAVASPEPVSPAPSREAGSSLATPATQPLPPAAAGRSLPPWELPPEVSSAVLPWSDRDASPSAADHGVPPWADQGASPSAADHGVPPWADQGTPSSAVDHGIPSRAGRGTPPPRAGLSVPPWELPGSGATGPVPVLPWPGQGGTPSMAPDGPGNGRATPPWAPATPPWPPAAPPRPPAAPPWPASPPWP